MTTLNLAVIGTCNLIALAVIAHWLNYKLNYIEEVLYSICRKLLEIEKED